MAAAHAGFKRSYGEMREYSVSAPSSRDVSPLRGIRESDNNHALRSGFDTPTHEWAEQSRKATFEHNASIVVVGVRGVGKSSLGVLAATAYNRRLIDSERVFLDATGMSTQVYRRAHGSVDYHQKHRQVFERTLKANDKDSVIICSFSDLENDGVGLLRDFAQTHPVIHVTRDAEGIQNYLHVWSEERVQKLLRASGPILRACSNFEFFNLTEKSTTSASPISNDVFRLADAKASNGLFLTLKRVERDFLKLLRNIVGDHDRLPSHHSAYPLSQVQVEDRAFTFSAVLGVDEVFSGAVDLDELQIGVDAIELQVPAIADWGPLAKYETEAALIRVAEAFAIIRRATILPIILSVAEKHAAGPGKLQDPSLLAYLLRLAPEYCVVSLAFSDTQVASLVADRARTAMIAHADLRQRPTAGWNDITCIEQYERGDQLGCDVVKITFPSTETDDTFAVQAFRGKVEGSGKRARLTAYNTGAKGRTSMCFNKVLTPVKRPGIKPNRIHGNSREPTVTAKEVFNALFAAFVYEPLYFFIYGANVSYSLSPAMHNSAYKVCGMPHNYFTHSAPTLDDFKRLARDPHFGGAAVVQPYKTGVLTLLDGLSSHAKAIGSVNTIIPIRELDGDRNIPSKLVMLAQRNSAGPVKALYGENTDWIGIRACLRRGLSPANTIRPQSTALICGAGGQARSTIYSLLSLGVRNIFLCNRTLANAQGLAEHYNELIRTDSISEMNPLQAPNTHVRVIDDFKADWPKDFRHPTIIVSTIPTQTADGSLTNFSVPEAWLKSPTGGIAIELAYRPTNTPMVQQMKAQAYKGWIFMDGFDILPEQGFAQFEMFTGRRAPRKLMRDQVLQRFKEQQSQGETTNMDPNPPGT